MYVQMYIMAFGMIVMGMAASVSPASAQTFQATIERTTSLAAAPVGSVSRQVTYNAPIPVEPHIKVLSPADIAAPRPSFIPMPTARPIQQTAVLMAAPEVSEDTGGEQSRGGYCLIAFE